MWRSPLQVLIAAIAIIAAVLLVFAPTVKFGFVGFDDDSNVYNNEYLNPVTSATLPRFWKDSYFELYTPVTYTLWTLAAEMPGARLATPVPVLAGGKTTLDARDFHALGVTFHLINSLLVFLLLLRLPVLRNRSPLYAGAGALVFAIHPFQVESVAWVTGNNNVFSGAFMLLALLLFTLRLEARDEKRALFWLIASTAAYTLAILAKPTAAALPFVAMALAIGAYKAPLRSLLLPLGTWVLVAVALLLVTKTTSDPVTDVSLPIWQRPFVAGDALGFYAQKLLLPIRMGVDYGRRPEWLRDQWWSYLTWIIPVGIAACLWFWYQRERSDTARMVLTGFAMFVLAVAPMLGFVPYYFHRYSTVADRYVYIAMVGFAVVTAVVLSRTPRQYLTAVAPSFAVLLAVLGYRCWQQTQPWRSSRTLYENAMAVYPKSMMAHNNLALVYFDKHELPEALAEAQLAVACPPQGKMIPAVAEVTLGTIYFAQGHLREAVEADRKALEYDATSINAYKNMAITLEDLGDHQHALEALEAATTAQGNHDDTVFGLGAEMMKQRLPDLGIPLLIEATKNGNKHAADANFILGVEIGNRGNLPDAEKYLRAALAIDPKWGEAADSLGRILVREGRTAEAQSYFQLAQRSGYGTTVLPLASPKPGLPVPHPT